MQQTPALNRGTGPIRRAAYGRRRNPMLTSAFRQGQSPPNKGVKLPPEVYTAAEVERLMRCCGRGPGAYRNRAMIAIQYRSLLRASEVTALLVRDVDFELGAIRVTHGKGDKFRIVHMDSRTAALIELWLRGPRARLNVPRGAPLFCTYERGIAGQPLRYAYYEQALKRAAARAGIEKRMHSHGLRHSGAFELLKEGYDIVTISDALGHNDLGTTQRYVRHHFPLDRIRALGGRHWPVDDHANGDANGSSPAAARR